MSSAGMHPILGVTGVTKRFAGATAIEGLDLSIQAGERVALIGPNGAGKTTAFNLITGVYTPDEGSITLQGQDLSRVAALRRIGLGMARTFQNIRLASQLSVLENVMLTQPVHGAARLFGRIHGAGNPWRTHALQALAHAGLAPYAHDYPDTLPYGIQKQIELVRALASDPKLLLLDEPAAGLNPAETGAMLRRLLEIARSGVTLLVVEHDMGFVSALCSRVVVLNFGRKIADGNPAEVRHDRLVREAYLGADDQLGAGHAA